MKIGLALGGGGTRGMAHIGVLEVLEKSGLKIDMISGTSMGAIIGAAYSVDKNIGRVKTEMLRLVHGKEIMELEKFSKPSPSKEKFILIEGLTTFVKELYLWNMRAVKKWIINTSQIGNSIGELVQEKTFKDLCLPFYAVSCDLRTGEEIVISEGSLKESLLASIAVPGVFNPVYKGERVLVDGGIVNLTPISVCKKNGADFVIAVDVSESIETRHFSNGMEVIFQSDLITQYELNRVKLLEADFVIRPEVRDISWAQFSASERCIEIGRKATEKVVSEIKTLVQKKKRNSFLKKIIPLWR
ncbi:MAG: patatin-like phospholipase family protein [Candidatus Omnitrophota bacterium]